MGEHDENRIGMELADGRYKIIERIGQGSMGHVYRAKDANLDTDVVIKFPVAAEGAIGRADLLDRFDREVRSLVKLSHPHVVKIIDVGRDGTNPFVVLQYLAGGSLKDRSAPKPGNPPRPMSPSSLHRWLADVARALDFLHASGHIHRDVKPANIMFDAYGNAYLGDFGIIKALGGEQDDSWKDNSLTAPGFLLGTPGYVAPEIVMGGVPDPRTDQYALALTVHEVLTGYNLMAGPTPLATIFNQTKLDLPSLSDLLPHIPRRLAAAVRRGLSKEPDERFSSCVELAEELLAEVPRTTPQDAIESGTSVLIGMGYCPNCSSPVPFGTGSDGDRVRCERCQKTAIIRVIDGNARLEAAPASIRSTAIPASPVRSRINENDATKAAPVLKPGKADDSSMDTGGFELNIPGEPLQPIEYTQPISRRTMIRNAVAGVSAVVGLAGGGYWIATRDRATPGKGDGSQAFQPKTLVAQLSEPAAEISIAFGTEKEKWLQAALVEYANTEMGKRTKINLIGMGSVEGARAILNGPTPTPIHVWSPASSAYRDVFVREWKLKHGISPILRAEDLAMTPMVFVMWKKRYNEFIKKYETVSFKTLGQAMNEPGGWSTIAGKPDWGHFKFGHTHPNQSNSGMLALVLMAYEFARKQRSLSTGDVNTPEFEDFFRKFERGITRNSGSLTNSTGTLMKDMVKRGPSQYDGLFVYENLAIEYMKIAKDYWDTDGELKVIYPDPNIWNEHPYYILDVPWSNAAERLASAEFLKFLMTAPIQKLAINEGFRPGNPSVPVRFPESPIVQNEQYGLRIDVPRMCAPPEADVVNSLLALFHRVE